MTAPVAIIEVGYGSTWQTEPADIVWTDETQNVLHNERLKCRRGGSSVRGSVDVGTAQFSLLNSDRRFDPTNTAGDLFGQLLPGTPVRIRAVTAAQLLTWDGDPLTWDAALLMWGDLVPVWSGTVPAWPQRYDRGNSFGWCPIGAYDRFDKLSRAKIPRTVLEAAVLDDEPSAYWRLDESTEVEPMVDSSGNGLHGDYDNVSFTDPLTIGDGGAMVTIHAGDSRGRYRGGSLPAAAPVTLEAWVQFDWDAAQIQYLMANARDYAWGSGLSFATYTSATGSPNGEVVINFRGLGGQAKFRGSTPIGDGEVHHVVFTMASTAYADMKLYVDGVEETKTLISGTTGGAWANHLIWSVGNAPDHGAGDFGLGGAIDEFAVYPVVLSAAEVLAHYEAGSLALTGQTTDERIAWVLDELGWPATLRNLSAGRTVLGSAAFQAGDGALEYLRLVAATEGGSLFMAADGDLTFQDRYWPYLETAATVSQFTFTDDDADTSYAEFQLDLDDELLVNVARFTRRDGKEQVVVDADSVALYGEAEAQRTNLLYATDEQVRQLARWEVATKSTPLPRVPKIRVPLHRYADADQATVLGLDLGHRVTAQRTPQGVGAQIDLELIVQGVEHDVANGEWWVTLFVSPVPQDSVDLFILGVSLLGSTDILAH